MALPTFSFISILFNMTQDQPAAKRGRPVTRKKTEAPQAPTAKKPVAKKRTVKRNLPDENKLPKLYETMGGRGGIFLKLKSDGINVYDDKTGTVRQIRYCPGEQSIFVDEQSENAVKEHVVFRNKMLTVRYDQPNLIAFLEKHPENADNGGGVFQLVNKEIDVEKEGEKEFLITDAITMIKARPIDELVPVAMALNINTDQKDLQLKRALVQYAKKNPTTFMGMFDNPMVHARTTVMQAMDFQIVTQKGGAIVWADTGKMILSVPVGQDAVDTLTRFVMTDKGASVLSEIDRQLEAIA